MSPRPPVLRVLLGAAILGVLSGCVDSDGVAPGVEAVGDPSFAVFDASTGYSADAYFLPPLADKNPTITGDFNPNLLPAMRVCYIAEEELGDPAVSCAEEGRTIIVEFPAGSFTLDEVNEMYALSWDTDGPATIGTIDTNRFQRLEILLADETVMGIDLDPQDPQGPGQSGFDAYAYRLGEVIPTKIWLGQEVLCEPLPYVTECITGAVVTQEGATLVLDEEGDRLVTDIFANTIVFPPGWDEEFIIVQLERIPRLSYLAEFGEECVLLDAPLFGTDCFRVSTIPEGVQFSGSGSLVSICLPPTAFSGLTEAEIKELTMFSADGEPPVVTQLADAAGNCPSQVASLVDVPDRGFLRYAALGLNAVAGLVLPTPVVARDLEFGALKSSYSVHAYGRPFELQVTEGDGTIIQASDLSDVQVTFAAVDRAKQAVEDATLHLSTSQGSINAPGVTDTDVTTDSNGEVTVIWTVDRNDSGLKTLTATMLGGGGGEVPGHDQTFELTTQTVTVSATVVGAPTDLEAVPSANIDDAVAGEPEEISVIVTDKDGNLVEGAIVEWTCTEQCIIPSTSTSNADGVATAQWTPLTAGSQITATATLGSLTATFTATVAPAAPADLNATQSATEGYIGTNVELGITVEDAYDNVIPDAVVSWTITGGGGTFVSSDGVTAGDGTAGATWTLGAVGANTATVTVGSITETFVVTGNCFNGWGTATTDGSFDGTEWACAGSASFTASVSGGSTPASVHWMNDEDNLYLAVRVMQPSLDKANDVRFEFDNDNDGQAEIGDDAIGYSVSGVFIDQFLSEQCAKKAQSGCGENDISIDGSGGLGNDGSWTTVELTHPLDGDANGQDFVRALGDPNQLGYLLILSQRGGGAQGDSQFPSFRSFFPISIVAPPAS